MSKHMPVMGTEPGEKPRRFYFDWSEQWSGLNPFQRFNWRDFTLIKIQGEFTPYTGRCELELALLGLACRFTYVYDQSFNERMLTLRDQATTELEGRTGCKVVDPFGVLDGLSEPTAQTNDEPR